MRVLVLMAKSSHVFMYLLSIGFRSFKFGSLVSLKYIKNLKCKYTPGDRSKIKDEFKSGCPCSNNVKMTHVHYNWLSFS